MSLDAELALAYKFANAPILEFPYPHFFIQDVFPKDFYERLQGSLPDPSLMIPIEKARPVTDPDTRRWLLLYDIYVKLPQTQSVSPAPAAMQKSTNVSFKF
jgi:hypothetical protein